MVSLTWIRCGSLAVAFATSATAQPTTFEPVRPGGIELSYLPGEGLGELPLSIEANGPTSAEAQARAFVMDHAGLRPGWHGVGTENEYVVVLASHAIAAPSDGPCGEARTIAFELARARAGLELAAMAGAMIEVEIEQVASESGMSATELQELVASRFKQDLDVGSRPDLGVRQRVAVEEFASRLARTCDEMIAGLQVFKVFEGPDDIAVVATWSRSTRALVEALRAPEKPIRGKAARTSIADWAASVGDELLYSHGCQLRTDERGELGLVAFGQADMAGSSRLFRGQAKLQASLAADAAIARFVSEFVSASQGRGLASLALATGYGDGSVSLAELSRRYREELRAASTMPDLPAATEIEVREILHPRNVDFGAKTICVVKHLNVSSLHAQERMRQWMRTQVDGGETDAVDGLRETEEGLPPEPRTTGGAGVTGETP